LNELWLCHNSLGKEYSGGTDVGQSIFLTAESNQSINTAKSEIISPEKNNSPKRKLKQESPPIYLLPQISQLTSLTVLSLQDNFISALPDSFGELINLERLYLQRNQLTELPLSLSSLNKLTDVDLSRNELNDFPSVIDSWPALTLLNLSGNTRLLKLPQSLYRIKNLMLLDVSGIGFREEPEVLLRMHWCCVCIDKEVKYGAKSHYGTNICGFECPRDEEREFYIYLKSRVDATKRGVKDKKRIN
jgi:hypothetical protein